MHQHMPLNVVIFLTNLNLCKSLSLKRSCFLQSNTGHSDSFEVSTLKHKSLLIFDISWLQDIGLSSDL